MRLHRGRLPARLWALIGSVLLVTTVHARQTRTPAVPSLPLVQPESLVYEGAFRVPQIAEPSEVTFAYGGTAIAFNPANKSLFIVGHDWRQQVAEISVPEVRKRPTVAELAVSTLLQPLTDITEGRLKQVNPSDPNPQKLGGLLPLNGKLYVSAYSYYDGAATQKLSHFVSGVDLAATGDIEGPYRINAPKAGFVSGYMAPVPEAWRALLGGPAVTGNCCIAIVSRTSYGPSLFAFDPSAIAGKNGAPASALVYYPEDDPLGAWDGTNPNFNGSTEIKGVVLPDGTSSALFFGRHGMGPFCYGAGTRDESLHGKPAPGTKFCYDLEDGNKGTHGFPYDYRVWAYDLKDLAAVKAGRRRPWQIKPYAVWTLPRPFPAQPTHLNGAAYDPATRRLFVSQGFAEGARPVIDVYTVNIP